MCVYADVCMREKTGNGNTSVTTDNDAYSLLPPTQLTQFLVCAHLLVPTHSCQLCLNFSYSSAGQYFSSSLV